MANASKRRNWRHLGLGFLAVGFSLVSAAGEGGAPGKARKGRLARLAELNSEALFGGKVKVKGDRFTLTFPGEGLFEKGFDCRARRRAGVVSDPAAIKDEAVKKVLLHGADGKFSFVGLSSGTAISRFPLTDDYKISFKLRIPTLMRGSKLVWYLNREKKDYLEVNFFRQAALVKKGRPRSRRLSPDPRFRQGPDKWFDRKSKGVPVEMSYKGGTLAVRMHAGKGKDGMTEVVTLENVKELSEGKLALSFEKVSFLVTDFTIEGQLPRKWLEAAIESLKSAGRLKENDPAGAKGDKKSEQGETKDSKKGKKKEGPDIDRPDPEADEDL